MNDEHRKARLNHLIAQDYGRASDFVRLTGIGKARVSQMTSAAHPFGEVAARKLAQELGLIEDWFSQTLPTPNEELQGNNLSVSSAASPANFGGRLRQARTERLLTLKQVAEVLNMSIQKIWNLENRGEQVEPVALFILADYFGVDARWLGTGEGAAAASQVCSPPGYTTTTQAIAKAISVLSKDRRDALAVLLGVTFDAGDS